MNLTITFDSVFLQDYATFEKVVLPLINQERLRNNKPVLSQPEEIMDCYLDLLNEEKKKQQQNRGNR